MPRMTSELPSSSGRKSSTVAGYQGLVSPPCKFPLLAQPSRIPLSPYPAVSILDKLNHCTNSDAMKLWVAPPSTRTTTSCPSMCPLSFIVCGVVNTTTEFMDSSITSPPHTYSSSPPSNVSSFPPTSPISLSWIITT